MTIIREQDIVVRTTTPVGVALPQDPATAARKLFGELNSKWEEASDRINAAFINISNGDDPIRISNGVDTSFMDDKSIEPFYIQIDALRRKGTEKRDSDRGIEIIIGNSDCKSDLNGQQISALDSYKLALYDHSTGCISDEVELKIEEGAGKVPKRATIQFYLSDCKTEMENLTHLRRGLSNRKPTDGRIFDLSIVCSKNNQLVELPKEK